MKPTQLRPGRKYISGKYEYTFIERVRNSPFSAYNIFSCPDFIGLNGPKDKGHTHLTDYEVRALTPVAQLSTLHPSLATS